MTTNKQLLLGGFTSSNEWLCFRCDHINNVLGTCPPGWVQGMCSECKEPMWLPCGEAALQAVDHLLCGVLTTTGENETCAVVYESEEDCFFWGDGRGVGFEDDDMQHPFVVVKAPPHKIEVALYPNYMDLYDNRGGASFFEFPLDDAHLAVAKIRSIILAWADGCPL